MLRKLDAGQNIFELLEEHEREESQSRGDSTKRQVHKSTSTTSSSTTTTMKQKPASAMITPFCPAPPRRVTGTTRNDEIVAAQMLLQLSKWVVGNGQYETCFM